MQSTSVDVVSVKPADAMLADPGHAEYVDEDAGAAAVVSGAAVAGDDAITGTSAAITAIAERTPIRRFKWEIIISSIW
jgi:pyruvate/2-oxoacid:ferredoxin oxidoreductase alpha subunit